MTPGKLRDVTSLSNHSKSAITSLTTIYVTESFCQIVVELRLMVGGLKKPLLSKSFDGEELFSKISYSPLFVCSNRLYTIKLS